jgi:hypothetical protein
VQPRLARTGDRRLVLFRLPPGEGKSEVDMGVFRRADKDPVFGVIGIHLRADPGFRLHAD